MKIREDMLKRQGKCSITGSATQDVLKVDGGEYGALHCHVCNFFAFVSSIVIRCALNAVHVETSVRSRVRVKGAKTEGRGVGSFIIKG